LSFGSAANRKKIAVGKLERIAAGDHRVAILEFDEAGIHLEREAEARWRPN
jgi:hypothetical protein